MKKRELESATISLNPMGFLHVVFKETDRDIDLPEAKEFFKASFEITNGKKMAALIDVNRGFPQISKEAFSYFANNEMTHLRLAEAFVVRSLAKRLLVRFYHQFHKPKNPLRVFADERKAANWLKEFTNT